MFEKGLEKETQSRIPLQTSLISYRAIAHSRGKLIFFEQVFSPTDQTVHAMLEFHVLPYDSLGGHILHQSDHVQLVGSGSLR